MLLAHRRTLLPKFQVTEDDLRGVFSEIGEIKRVNIRRKGDGFTTAYVEYHKASHAAQAVKQLNRRQMGEKNIAVKPGKKTTDNAPQATETSANTAVEDAEVYVCFLATEVTEAELEEVFSEVGKVKKVNVRRKNDGFTTAYVEYYKASHATQAIKQLNRKQMGEKSIGVKPGKKTNNAPQPAADRENRFDRGGAKGGREDRQGGDRNDRPARNFEPKETNPSKPAEDFDY